MINKLPNNNLDLQATSVYDFNELTLQELLCKFFSKINECVDVSNQALNFLIWLKEEGLPIEVQKEIEKMYLDGRLTEIINQLANDVKGQVTEIKQDLANHKAEYEQFKTSTNETLTSHTSQLEQNRNLIDSKMDKNTNNISVTQINKNLGKLDQTYMTDEFLQQILGNTPINSVPTDNSITNEKLTNDCIYWSNIKEKKSISLSMLESIKVGYKFADKITDIDDVKSEKHCITDFISIDKNLDLTISSYLRVIFYDINKNPIDGYRVMSDTEYSDTLKLSSIIPTNYSKVQYIRCCFFNTSIDKFNVIQNNIVKNVENLTLDSFILSDNQIKKILNNVKENTIDLKNIYQTDVVLKKVNLFDKNKTIKGRWDISSGIIGFYNNKYSTDFIKCKPNTIYSKTGVATDEMINNSPRVTLFDKNLNPIREIRTSKSFITTPDTMYFSFWLDTEDTREYPYSIHPQKFVVIEGLDLPNKYIPYVEEKINITQLNVKNDNLNINCLDEIKLKNTEVDTTYFTNKNITLNSKFSIGTNSTETDNNYFISDFIPFDVTKPIKIKNFSRIVFYNEFKEYITGYGRYEEDLVVNYEEQNNIVLDFSNTLSNAKYIKVCLKKTKYDTSYFINQDGFNIIYEKYRNKKLKIYKDNLAEDVLGNNFKNIPNTNIVFKKNSDFNSTNFRIPFMCVTNKGTIIVGCDIRYNSGADHSLIDIGTARSEDGGKTWIDKTIAIKNPQISSTLSRVMDGTILATKQGRVFLIGNKFNDGNTGWTDVNTPNDPNWDIVLYHSDDDGRTWQFNQSLKTLLPNGQISFLGGVGSGIQMKDGTLVFPIQMARYNNEPYNIQSGIIYSKDNGVSWNMSKSLVPTYTSECSIVEYPTGTILINCRQDTNNYRSVYKTDDLGDNWTVSNLNGSHATTQTNPCQGHMCKIKVGFDKEVVLFTNPINDGTNRSDGAYEGYDRSNLSLSILQNNSKFTPIYTIYRPHSDGYSCMAFDEKNNRLYVVTELDRNLVFIDLTHLLPTIQMYKNLES